MERSPLTPRPLIYAHRGDRSRADDNTLRSYALAVEAGADGIELDVRPTSDGVLILAHDNHVGDLPRFAEITFDELRSLRPDVPTFAEMLAQVPNGVFLNVEIKSDDPSDAVAAAHRLVEATLAEIESVDDMTRILLSSFDPEAVAHAAVDRPELLRGQLITEQIPLGHAIDLSVGLGVDALHPPMVTFEDDPVGIVEQIHAAGLSAVVWNANTPDDVRSVATAGIDVIITDNPTMARTAINSVLA